MKINYEFPETDDSCEETVALPAKYKVCLRCRGRGVHDCWYGGLTGQELDEQGPEFREDYLAGVYDRACDMCQGQRVLLVVDVDLLDVPTRKRFDAAEDQRHEYGVEMAHERRMGY